MSDIFERADTPATDNQKVEKVVEALNNSNYVWRTVPGIATETNLDQGDVLSALTSLPEGTLATAKSRQGVLYTTRDHYFKNQSFFGRLLTAASGQFK